MKLVNFIYDCSANKDSKLFRDSAARLGVTSEEPSEEATSENRHDEIAAPAKTRARNDRKAVDLRPMFDAAPICLISGAGSSAPVEKEGLASVICFARSRPTKVL